MDVLGVGDLFGGLLAGAGVGAIIFGFAFKDIGENFLAGILMAFNQPFDTGDIIEVDGHKGVVRDLDMRTVHIRNAEGKDIYLPNSLILKSTLINYTKDGSIRLSFDIGIAPEENIEQIRTIVLSYIDSSDLILKNPKPNVLVNGLGEFTVDLTVLFWVDILVDPAAADETLGHTIRSLVIKDVKELLENANVSMPSQVLEHKMYRSENFRMENP
jgi:small-conductance mechanosensitive channel